MILPQALIIWNVIITRTFFQTTIPDELLDAARIDGSDDFGFIARVVLPLSSAILAVNVVFYAVAHWNAFFDAFLFLNDQKLFPLQLVLRKILIMNTVELELVDDPEALEAMEGLRELLKYSLIIVSSVPVLCLYPIAQRYFVQGVMLGSIKG
jgi:multiple sugar transport system permease protein/putative aldouronate transport system permease protein